MATLLSCPLGKHQAVGKWSRLLNPKNFKPMPNEALLSCWGISLSDTDRAKIMSFEEKGQGHARATLTLMETKSSENVNEP
jgi:hypothetical protein